MSEIGSYIATFIMLAAIITSLVTHESHPVLSNILFFGVPAFFFLLPHLRF